MAKLLKLRRGTTSQHSSFTGAEGEVTVDTTKDTLVVHDGSTQAGHPVAAEDMSNVSSASIAGRLGTDSIAVGKIAAGTLPSDVKVTDSNVSGNLSIVNADVTASAAIAGSKITPDFAAQQITTTGKIQTSGEVEAGSLDINGAISPVQIDHTGGSAVSMNRSGKNLTFNANYGAANTHSQIDTNCTDLRLATGGTDRLAVNSSGASVTGNITVTGTVDGRDVAADGSKLDTYQANGSSYIRSDADDSASGSYSFTNSYNEFGNSTGNVSNDGSWNARVNVAGSQHARLDVKSVSDGIIMSMSSHTGHSKGYVGTRSSHALGFYSGNAERATLSTSGSLSTTVQGTVWGASNDGSGSGLDADKLDGVEGSSFARSDADDTLSGDITFTNSGAYPVVIGAASGMSDARLLLRGSNNPYIRFREGNTDKAYIQWNDTGYLELYNEEHARSIRIKNGASGLIWNQGGTESAVWHAGNDGSGSGLDADKLDGMHAGDFMQQGAPNSTSHYNADSWLEFSSNNGLYYPNNWAYHVYLDNGYFLLRNNQNYNGIAFNTNSGSRRGYVYVDNSNQIGFLNTSANWSLKCDNSGNVTATGNVTAYSDARLKTNVNTIQDALSICGKLRGVSFDWKESGKHSIGVIAQEVEEVLPELVLTQQVTNGNTEENPNPETKEIKSVDYGKIVGVLINAINELKAEVDELKGGK